MQDKENRLRQRRLQILQFCRENKISERSAWVCLAKKRYLRQLNGKSGLLYIKQKKNPFKSEHIKIRERIVGLISHLRFDVCNDFIKLLNFSKNIMQQTDYLIDFMLCDFLEKYVNEEYDPLNQEVMESVTRLIDTLMEEFSAIWESTLIFPLDIVTDFYAKRFD